MLVVGAGPAGSSAARAAAEAGASVLLLDRATFPRYKTCGGGLLGESLRLLPESARPTVESRVADTVFTQRFGRAFRLRRRAAYLAMVRRTDFDQALADAARQAGARFVDGVTVRSIQAPDAGDGSRPAAAATSNARAGSATDSAPDDDAEGAAHPVLVTTSRGTVAARTVIGADGAGGRVGRWVGVDIAAVDLGLEDEVAMPADSTPWRDRVLLDWGGASGSYAWVFPKRDSLTVGVIQRRGAPDETREYLAAWRRHLGLTEPRATTLHSSGHLTQWRRPGSPVRRGTVLVAGDTAGLLEPWTREGISFALRSGTWAGTAAAHAAFALAFAPPRPTAPRSTAPDAAMRAAETTMKPTSTAPDAATRAAETTMKPTSTAPDAADAGARAAAAERALGAYEQRVLAELEPEQTVGARVLDAFERHPTLVHALLRTPPGARFFVRFCSGDTTLARLGHHTTVLRIIDRLGRPPRPRRRRAASAPQTTP